MNPTKFPIISARLAAGIAAILAVFYGITSILVQGQYLPTASIDIYLAILRFGMAAAFLYGARYAAFRKTREARSWRLWALGMVSGLIGDIIFVIYSLVLNRPPFPSIADIFYVLDYLFMWLGLLTYPSEKMKAGERKFVHLDNLVVILGSALSFWALLIAPTLQSGKPNLFSYLLVMLYPVLDMVLFWELFDFFRTRKRLSTSLPLVLFGTGILALAASDISYVVSFSETDSYYYLMSLGWIVGTLLLSLAAIAFANSLSEEPGEPREIKAKWLHPLKSWPIYMPYLWVGLAYIVLVISLPIGRDNLYLVVGIGLLIALVIFRQVLTIIENERLFQQAQQELVERTRAQEALREANLVLDQRIQERTQDLRDANRRLSESNDALEVEIGERKQTEKLLHQRIETEELIATISASFINLPVEEIDLAIERALQLLGEFVEADRSYIFQSFNHQEFVSNTYEWCRTGVEPQKASLQAVPLARFPWWRDRLNRHEVINLASMAELPAEAQAEKKSIEAQRIQSLIVVPMAWNQAVVGFLGCDAVRGARVWRNEEIVLLKIAGELLVTALQRKASQEALSHFARRLKTLHEIDQAILAEKSTSSIITYALGSLFELIACRSGGLVTLAPDENRATLFMFRGEQDIQSSCLTAGDDPQAYGEILRAVEALGRGNMLQGHQIPGLIFRSLFRTDPVSLEESSLIAVPLSQQGHTSGLLCLRLGSADGGTSDQVESMREVAHSLAIALQQAKMRQDLQQRMASIEASLHEKEILLKEIHHRVKNNLQVISSLLSLQTHVIQEPTARTALQDSQMRVRTMALIHENLYQSADLSHIVLGPYIDSLASNLFHSYQRDGTTINLATQVQNIAVGIDNAIPMGLILNELISNSLKHAFPEQGCGEIGIELQRETAQGMLLRYYDTGVGLPLDFNLETCKSLGMRLVYSLAKQIGAEIKLTNQAGVKFEFRFPIDCRDSVASTREAA